MDKPIKELINKFKDYANCADASYAMLHHILSDEGDGIRRGFDNNGKLTSYARAIEAGFNEEKVIEEDWFSNTTLDNDITELPKDTPHDQISQRTKDFVSRFELVKHQKDTNSGFSATLFKDTRIIRDEI